MAPAGGRTGGRNRFGQADLEFRSQAGRAFDPNRSATAVYDGVDNGQAHPCSALGFPGRKKGFENPFDMVRLDTGAGITDPQKHAGSR